MTTLAANIRIASPAAAGAPAPAVARLSGVCKRLGVRRVLRDIDLELPAGCWVAVHGDNGAGKSTLLRLLATLTTPTSGTIELFGQRTSRRAADIRARIGFVGHQLMLYRDLSAAENLAFFGRLYGVRDLRARIEELIDLFGLRAQACEPVGVLSRGTAQKVAIARALIHSPDLLVADEPFTGLDTDSAALLTRHLCDLRGRGKTIVMSHHDLAASTAVADRVLTIKDGRIGLGQAADACVEGRQ